MCLQVSKSARVKIAKEDIIAYKKLIYCPDIGKYISWYRHYISPLNTLLTTTLGRKRNLVSMGMVEEGFHSYKRKNSLTNFKAIIPKGTRYWSGTFSSEKCYCSESVIYQKIEEE